MKTPRLLVGKIHRDCEATSYLSRGFLLGSINRYPPETTCWQCVTTAGSGWQDGPVYLTFTNQERTAAALRLEAVDANGKLMTHPYSGAFHISKIDRLYPHESFPPEPKLRCLQSRGALLCLHKIDRVDATLRKLGFNLHFHRFDGAVRIKDGGTPGDGAISGPVILELGEAWAAFFPLSRVDMAKSCLSSGEFIAPAFDVSATAEGLDLAMYNCDGEARRYVQNHVSGGFFAVVKEKGEIGALTDFLGYVDAVSVKEEWRSDRVNAHIDKRDSIREVTAKTPDVELRLGWNHYDDAETRRTVDGKPVKATSRTRVVSF